MMVLNTNFTFIYKPETHFLPLKAHCYHKFWKIPRHFLSGYPPSPVLAPFSQCSLSEIPFSCMFTSVLASVPFYLVFILSPASELYVGYFLQVYWSVTLSSVLSALTWYFLKPVFFIQICLAFPPVLLPFLLMIFSYYILNIYIIEIYVKGIDI